MTAPLEYRLAHSTGTVELTLTPGRFVVKTHGTGLADKLRVTDIALAELRQFALTPTSAAQNSSGPPAQRVVDGARDAELIFSYVNGGKVKRRRVFVASGDPALRAIVAELASVRPDASLLDRAPKDAYRALRVLSPEEGILVVLAVIFAIPVLGGLIWVVIHALG